MIHDVIGRSVNRLAVVQPCIHGQLEREGECLLAPARDKAEDEELSSPEYLDTTRKIVVRGDQLIQHLDGLLQLSLLDESGHTDAVLLLGPLLPFGDLF